MKTDGATIKDNKSKFLLINEIIFLEVYESITAEAPLGHKQFDLIGSRIDEVSKDKDGMFLFLKLNFFIIYFRKCSHCAPWAFFFQFI